MFNLINTVSQKEYTRNLPTSQNGFAKSIPPSPVMSYATAALVSLRLPCCCRHGCRRWLHGCWVGWAIMLVVVSCWGKTEVCERSDEREASAICRLIFSSQKKCGHSAIFQILFWEPWSLLSLSTANLHASQKKMFLCDFDGTELVFFVAHEKHAENQS